MDDVLTLIAQTFTEDSELNPVASSNRREVFCRVGSVSRSEFYQAAQADLHPGYVFTLANFADYEGERLAEYVDWRGTVHVLYITRTYRVPDSDEIELTCEERTGDGN